MDKSNFVINSTDLQGNAISIYCEGTDDQKLAKFGGLDLHVKAIKTMIGSIDTKFSEEDYLINEKVIALILNEVGETIRYLSGNEEMLESFSNMDLVKDFISCWDENKEIVELIKNENELIQKKKNDYF